MAENPLKQLERYGQAPWLDYIRRTLLPSAEFKRMLAEDGLKGMTSNPTIFEKAIDGSSDYDEQFVQLVREGKEVMEIYEALTIQDIQSACDVLRPLYDSSASKHGYVSYEVSPELADDTAGTIDAARRYWKRIARPNVMIKVPSTPAGLPAITTLISEGINVNVTLMFSMTHYNNNVAEAYIKGIEKRARKAVALSIGFSRSRASSSAGSRPWSTRNSTRNSNRRMMPPSRHSRARPRSPIPSWSISATRKFSSASASPR